MFKHFTNPIYCATQLTNYTCVLLKIYILWREYNFVQKVQNRPPEIRHYMSGKNFVYLKKFYLKMVLFELIQDSWAALVQLIFADELSRRSLWDISSKLTPDSDEMTITRVFIGLNSCKDFFLTLPLNYYIYTTEYNFSIFKAVKLLFLEFISTQVKQFVILSSWAYSSSMISNVSQSTLIVTIILFILTFVFARDFCLVEILIEDQIRPFTDTAILKELQPFLKRMHFPEENIYLYKAKETELPNAFTVGHDLFNNEKIVIADNIIGKNPHLNDCCTHGEVISIIMHELGHVFHRHILITSLLELSISISTCVLFVLLYQPNVFDAFGFPGETPALISILIRMDVLLGFNVLCAVLFMLHLRRNEYQADVFSFTFSRLHFRQALLKISLVRPEDLQVHDPLYSAWTFSHPSLIERLNYLYK